MFRQLLLVYIILIMVISVPLIRQIIREEGKSSKPMLSFAKNLNLFMIIIGTIVPQILCLVSCYGFFLDHDSPVYLNDSNVIIAIGYINPSEFQEDLYYRSFPIFFSLTCHLNL